MAGAKTVWVLFWFPFMQWIPEIRVCSTEDKLNAEVGAILRKRMEERVWSAPRNLEIYERLDRFLQQDKVKGAVAVWKHYSRDLIVVVEKEIL